MIGFDAMSAAIIDIVKRSPFINQNAVYDYEKSDLGAFPAVTVSASDSPAHFADTARNMRNYTFSVKIFQERPQQGEANTESIMRKAVDDMINQFDTNPMLKTASLPAGLLISGGYVMAAPSKWGYNRSDQAVIRYAEILLVVTMVQ